MTATKPTRREEMLTKLAIRMNLTAAQTIALPAVIERSADAGKMTEEAMVEECLRNRPLANYLAGICAQVTR